MATLTIRNLDEEVKSALRIQAARHGQSMEEEARSILRQTLSPQRPSRGLGQRLASRFAPVVGEWAETLPIPARACKN